ncbi:unnamed protein product [Paramecium octaurelia]|uniref:B box-type domain-containing protein n=1 Tax=Paramecium octaurelia TaxID=43137 RepID=A0A8S1XDS5_PAROT|nr:unnamed protein product [Paramecium octaurelia]
MSNLNQKNCVHHNRELTYFCESCEEPICKLCTTLGPHNYTLHRINSLQEAFKMRVEHIKQEILHNILPKRDEIFAQINRIEYRIQEIKYVKNIIERDCRAEMNGIEDRLNQAEQMKQTILQHQISVIQSDLDEMNDLAIQFFNLTKKNDYLEFLFDSQSLLDRIEFLIAKPYNKGIDEIPDDLPRELTDLRLLLGKMEGQQQMLEVLNEIIWRMINERKQEEELSQQILRRHSENEIKEWQKLVEFFTEQLKESEMICYFCNEPLNIKTINKSCKKNKDHSPENFVGYTVEKPTDQQIGTKRHFYGHAVLKAKMPQLQEEQKKLPSAVIIEGIMSKIKVRMQDKSIKLLEIFQEHDNDKNGFVNEIIFNYIMQEHLQLIDEEIENIVMFMDCKSDINYNILFNMLKSSNLIQKMESDLVQKYRPPKSKKRTPSQN